MSRFLRARESLPVESGHLRRTLGHYDTTQLWYQLAEIVDERTYLRHGVDVREGDVVLDVGANVGVAAAFFAHHCRAGLVHSFEPVGPVFELLSENLAPFDVCALHPYGLSSAPGESTITYYPGAAAMSSLHADPSADRALVETCLLNRGVTEAVAHEQLEGRYEPVTLRCALRTLSQVLQEQALDVVDLLKIDVEKAELEVLQGLEEHHWPRIRQLAVEVHDEHGRCAAIATMLTDRGFRVVREQDPTMTGTNVHMLYATRR